MLYPYTAVDASGKKARGTIGADDRSEAIARLLDNGLTALELEGLGEGTGEQSVWQRDIGDRDIHKARISNKKLLSFLNQMALMMKAGVSLSLAMGVLIDTQKDRRLKKILQEINRELYGGTPVSAAMAKFDAFPELIVSMVQTGEENGRLDTAFERSAAIVYREIALSARVRGAMGYPCFLLCLTVALLAVMNTVVLPNFTGVFRQFGASLPAITVGVMKASDFLSRWWYAIAGGIAAAAGGFFLARKNVPAFALAVDRVRLKIPVVGKISKENLTARFCRVMASLVQSGVDIVRSLEIARDVTSNRFVGAGLSRIISDVKIGSAINASMARYPFFDSLLVSMIRVGEESGMIAESFEKMADLYERQAENSTKRFTAMLEPAMTIFIALIVGTVVISIVVPIFGMYGVISGG